MRVTFLLGKSCKLEMSFSFPSDRDWLQLQHRGCVPRTTSAAIRQFDKRVRLSVDWTDRYSLIVESALEWTLVAKIVGGLADLAQIDVRADLSEDWLAGLQKS